MIKFKDVVFSMVFMIGYSYLSFAAFAKYDYLIGLCLMPSAILCFLCPVIVCAFTTIKERERLMPYKDHWIKHDLGEWFNGY